MRVDKVEASWDPAKKKWLMRFGQRRYAWVKALQDKR